MDNINNINNYIKINYTGANIVKNNNIENNNTPQRQNLEHAPNNTIISKEAVFLYDIQNIKMTRELILKYIQSLLNMPDSIEEFFNQYNRENEIQNTNINKNALIIIKNILDVAKLSEFLGKNSKIASQKILQTISQALSYGITDTSQLREILTILNTIGQNTTQIQNYNSIKELLLLYIPINPQAFEKASNDTKEIKEEDKEKNQSEFSILFETINFSNFICKISDISGLIYINLSVIKDFPCNFFQKIIKTKIAKTNIKTMLEVNNKHIKNEKRNKIQNFKIVSSNKVSINTLMISKIIIETVFEIDKNYAAIEVI